MSRRAPAFTPAHKPAPAQALTFALALALTLLFGVAATPALAQTGSGGRNLPEHEGRPYVVLVSFDGMRHDYAGRVATPNLDRLARRGVRAERLVPAFPSKTFPNHYTIATGMYTETHGLVDNTMYDAELDAWYMLSDRAAVEDGRWYGGEPVWVAAERAGLVTAAFFWPGTEAPVQGMHPSEYRLFDASVPAAARVDRMLEWLARPAATRPHLVLGYFEHLDDAGHRYGPDSPQVDSVTRVVDGLVGRLLDGIDALPIAGRTTVILVSDHGMAGVDRDRVIYLDDLMELSELRVRLAGPYAGLSFSGDTARLEAAYAALRRRLRGAAVYKRQELPERLRYRRHARIPDLLVLADEGRVISTRAQGPGSSAGEHGYDPALPSMSGIFYAAGPRIRPGSRLGAIENVHVYPLMMHLLGLAPNPAADGRLDVLRPVLRDAAAAPAGRS